MSVTIKHIIKWPPVPHFQCELAEVGTSTDKNMMLLLSLNPIFHIFMYIYVELIKREDSFWGNNTHQLLDEYMQLAFGSSLVVFVVKRTNEIYMIVMSMYNHT